MGNDNDNTDKSLDVKSLEHIKALMCSKLPFTQPVSYFTSNQVVLHPIKIWNQFRRSFSLTDLSQGTPVARNHMFIPSFIDEVFERWSRRGMLSLSDLYIDGNCASFEQLVQKYHIPKSHFYRYLQLRNFVFSNFKCFPLCPPTCLLDSIFDCKLVKKKRTISTIYKILYSHNLMPLDHLKNN